jgi:hypothetical protein
MSNCLADCLQQGEINERFARRVHLDSVLQALATATADAPAIALSLTGIIDDLGLFDWIRSKLLSKAGVVSACRIGNHEPLAVKYDCAHRDQFYTETDFTQVSCSVYRFLCCRSNSIP